MADSSVPPAAEVLAAAEELYARAAAAEIRLRFIGSIAVWVSCPRHRHLLAALGRRPVRDIDVVAYSRDEGPVKRLFQVQGYFLDPAIVHSEEFGIKRLIFLNPGGRCKVDVFLDQLIMAHTVDLRNRLELASPTVPPVDLLLSKLQIHAVTENDLIDLAVLLAEHDLGPGHAIDLDHLVRIMARDWGFHRTTTDNLRLLSTALDRFEALPSASTDVVRARIARIQQAIQDVPKTRRWRLRSRVGTRIRWYEVVDEVDRDVR
jgi:hypothetical protein